MPYYGVAKGFNPGVYYNWAACKAQVNGFSGASYAKFDNEQDAMFFARNGYVNDQNSYNLQTVYIDGACRGNGNKYNTAAGYGVYYGRDDNRNAAIALDSVDRNNSFRPTNQRAELHALNHALKNIYNDIQLGNCNCKTKIQTDSMFAIKSVTEWCYKWNNNGWTNTKGETVANVDLVRHNFILVSKINLEYGSRGWGDIEFVHVRGHSGDYGNEQADRLANIGADNYGDYL